MAYSLIAHTTAIGNIGGPGTSPPINTSGADFLVAVLADYNAASTTLSDSKNGTSWTQRTAYTSNLVRVRIYYIANPMVGLGHTFTITPVGLSYPSCCIAAFSGSLLVSPYDTENGAGELGLTTIQPGSITPAQSTEVCITGLGGGAAGSTLTIGSGFSITDQVAGIAGQNFASGLAYKIKTDANAENPTWTMSLSGDAAADIASFKSASSNAYTITAAQGSYILSGQAVSLLHKSTLSLVQGSYTLSGQVASLLHKSTLTLAQGAYSLNGQAITLKKNSPLIVAQGSYILTGEAVNFPRTEVVAAAQGSYSLNGQNVGLIWSNPPTPLQHSLYPLHRRKAR